MKKLHLISSRHFLQQCQPLRSDLLTASRAARVKPSSKNCINTWKPTKMSFDSHFLVQRQGGFYYCPQSKFNQERFVSQVSRVSPRVESPAPAGQRGTVWENPEQHASYPLAALLRRCRLSSICKVRDSTWHQSVLQRQNKTMNLL